MVQTQPPSEPNRRPRPGGRSARVRAAVLQATLELLAETGYDGAELPEVARRAGVHPTTIYRRWGTKSRLVGEAILERSRPLSPTPDTGSLRTDLERLLLEGAGLVRTPAVRALAVSTRKSTVSRLLPGDARSISPRRSRSPVDVDPATVPRAFTPGSDAGRTGGGRPLGGRPTTVTRRMVRATSRAGTMPCGPWPKKEQVPR